MAMAYRRITADRVQAEDFLGDALIRQDTFSCYCVYDDEVGFTELFQHRAIEISMVIAGNGIHRVLGQAIPCAAGDIYVLNTNIPHRYFAVDEGEPLTVRRILFDPKDWFNGEHGLPTSTHFCYGVFSENASTAYAMLTQRVAERIMTLSDAAEIELLEKKNEWRSVVGGYLSLILITVGRYMKSAIKNIPETDLAEWTPISALLAAVKDNYGDPGLTLETMADSFYVSKSSLSRLFKQLMGESFPEYLKRVRLSGACALLSETELTVDEIMKKCGLRDLSSFYRAFGDFTGMTPSQYRKEKKQNINQKGEKAMSILTEISENLQKGKAKIVKELVQQAIDEGLGADVILDEGLLAGRGVIGEKFKNNEVYVPEVLVAARAMNMGSQILKPYLVASGVVASGKVCIGTVQGDLHDIGKNIVKMMMEGKGLEVIDLGTDVSAETFVNVAIEQNCQIICCSALLTTTMGVMEEVVKKAEEAGIRDKVKIMVGGAPVSEEFCKKIGADVYTSDAASAADAAVALCKA